MEAASEPFEPFSDPESLASAVEIDRLTGPATVPPRVAAPVRRRPRARVKRTATAWLSLGTRQELLWIAVLYLAARIVLLITAYVQSRLGHAPFQNELANWDGFWYRELANKGYPSHVSYAQTTLGFFPLFPLTIWPVEHLLTPLLGGNLQLASTYAGALVSGTGGLIATVLVHRLTDGWWGRAVARRATILFILFPGSVVFTMVYSEGLLLPLAAGCIYALERRRWLLAGVLAGLGTAVQPVGLALAPVCLLSAGLELRRRGWDPRRAWRACLAPLLSVTGVVGFMGFLWMWTGSPFANYIAQHHGWSEKTSLLALWETAKKLAHEIDLSHFNQPTINLNLIFGLLGAALLVGLLVLLWFCRHQVSPEAICWTAIISFLAFTSSNVPPNPRMLITAFPALMTIARYAEGKWFEAIVWINGILLVGLSLLTFYGLTLRP